MNQLLEHIKGLPEGYKPQWQMSFEKNRLDSFEKWVFDDSNGYSAMKMAEAGFYSIATTDEPDAVQWFNCCKKLVGWEADDNPWKEHLSHSKNCKFAKLQKAEESLKMSEFLDLIKEQENIIIDNLIVDINRRDNEEQDVTCAILYKLGNNF